MFWSADKQIPGEPPIPELIDIKTAAGILAVGERYVRSIVFHPRDRDQFEMEVPRDRARSAQRARRA
jgi:hypothetical protein